MPTGSIFYLAPELVRSDEMSSMASDVWALGCIGLWVRRKSNPIRMLAYASVVLILPKAI